MGQEEIQKAILEVLKKISESEDVNVNYQELAKPNILKYLLEYHQLVAQCILDKESKEEQMLYIKGLIQIYPLSASTLGDVLNNEFNKVNFEEKDFSEIAEWFDLSEVMMKHFRKMISRIRAIDFDDISSGLKDEIEDYTDQRNDLAKERNELESLLKERNSAIKEIEALRREVEELKNNTNEAELNNQRDKLQNEKNKLIKESKKNAEELQKIKNELDNIKAPDNSKFNKALKSFSDVMHNLLEDGVS